MIVAPKPNDEAERLATLARFDILDTLPERAYDAITLLASHICETPISVISIVDADRQWFKSRVGIDVEETPRDLAFCAHAILEPEALLVIPDASADARFAEHPMVVGDPMIRFYAGAPLVTSSGQALGSLCVIDRAPRTLTDAQVEALRALSTQVMALLELRWAVSELERSQKELRDVMKQREELLATVSHEIRTPLSAVMGYVGLLTDPSFDISDEERSSMMATVGREAEEVSFLIEDLLVAAKEESGSLQVQSVDVNLAAQTAQVLEGLNPKQVSNVTVDAGTCRAIGDPGRVRQIIRNLVTNAFRYGGPNVAITVDSDGDRCRLEVSDDGPGIPPSEQDRVFERFEQSDHGPVVSGSLGLGLPISRLLAERMGGSLAYRRVANRTVFRLELPARGDDEPAR